jgi:hypothetical protein
MLRTASTLATTDARGRRGNASDGASHHSSQLHGKSNEALLGLRQSPDRLARQDWHRDQQEGYRNSGGENRYRVLRRESIGISNQSQHLRILDLTRNLQRR